MNSYLRFRMRETLIEHAFELAKKELKLEQAREDLKECMTPITISRQILTIEQYCLDIKRIKLEIQNLNEQLKV
jgi:hypothetical protein